MNKLKTVNIKGKNYVTVNERIKYFREKNVIIVLGVMHKHT